MPKTIGEIRAEYDAAQGRPFYAEGRFAIVNCSFRDGRNGRFATVELRDGTGSFTARCFESALVDGLAVAGAIDVRLKVEEFNGSMSCVIGAYDVAVLDDEDIMRLAGLDPEVHRQRVAQLEV